MNKATRRSLALAFTFVLAIAVSLVAPARTALAEIASGTSGTCTWVIDDDGTLTISPAEGEDEGTLGSWTKITQSPWAMQYATKIKKVVVKEKVYVAETGKYLFSGLSYCESMDLSGLDTSKATNLSNMFSNCSSLTSLDISNFDTSNVTDMSSMFSSCQKLPTITFGEKFDTSKVTTMSVMFNDCQGLTSLDVSKFDTSQVTNMASMFNNCKSLTSLDVSGFDTSSVTTMNSMFQKCSSLASLDVSGFDTSKVTSMNLLFSECKALPSIDVSAWDTSAVTSMRYTFAYCEALTTLDLTNWDVSKVNRTNSNWTYGLIYMFLNSSNLTTIYSTSDWKLSDEESKFIFTGATSLVGGAGTKYDADNVSVAYAHPDGGTDNPGYFSAKPYTVKFDANADDATGSMDDQDFVYGTAQNLTKSAFSRSGYTFTGWNTAADGSGTSYADEAEVKNLTSVAKGEVTLYAQWDAKPTYTVAFDANDGTGSMDSQGFTVGESQALTSNAFTREGYTFKGWNTAADGSGTSYADGATVTDLTTEDGATVTLYAQWDAIVYTITYDPNGGNWDGDTASRSFDYTYGTAISIYEQPTRDGYTFVEWRGSSYQPGDSYTVVEDHTFTAIWEKDAVVKPKSTTKARAKVLPQTGDPYGNEPVALLAAGAALLAAGGTAVAVDRRRQR